MRRSKGPKGPIRGSRTPSQITCGKLARPLSLPTLVVPERSRRTSVSACAAPPDGIPRYNSRCLSPFATFSPPTSALCGASIRSAFHLVFPTRAQNSNSTCAAADRSRWSRSRLPRETADPDSAASQKTSPPIAHANAPIAGFIVAEADRAKGHIITIDVIAPARRYGVGSLLLGAAEDRLRAAHCQLVELETAVDNISALSFYKRHGYSVIERSRAIIRTAWMRWCCKKLLFHASVLNQKSDTKLCHSDRNFPFLKGRGSGVEEPAVSSSRHEPFELLRLAQRHRFAL